MRLVVYRVISLWCSTLQEGSHCEIIADTLIKEVFDDILTRSPTTKKSVNIVLKLKYGYDNTLRSSFFLFFI